MIRQIGRSPNSTGNSSRLPAGCRIRWGLGVGILIAVLSLTLKAQDPQKGILPEPRYYGTASWNSDSLGTHRVVIRVNEKADAVRATIPWRRRDSKPETKNVIIIDAADGSRITNVRWSRIDRETGDFTFQPRTAPGEYYVYYLIYRSSGGNYPRGWYQKFEQTAEEAWLQRVSSVTESSLMPAAEIVQFQAIDSLNSFYPMEVIATRDEVRQIVEANSSLGYLLFPEDRSNPIKMTKDLPYKWIRDGVRNRFSGDAERGEFFSFQIGLFAPSSSVESVRVRMGDLRSEGGGAIPSGAFSSFNTGGVDWRGERLQKDCTVEKGAVQPLWMGVQVPEDAHPGRYQGEITVAPAHMKEQTIKFQLHVSGGRIVNSGDNEPTRLSRLRWLDSQIASDDDTIPRFTQVKVDSPRVSCLGRSLLVESSGFPGSIESYFSPEVTRILPEAREILTSPVVLVIEDGPGRVIPWENRGFQFTKKAPGAAAWKAQSRAGDFDISVRAQMECDGYVDFQVSLTALARSSVSDIRLEIPLDEAAAKYMMGMGVKGGYRPVDFGWKWDVAKNQDAIWVGDVNAGLQLSFRDTNYIRPLNTNFYHLKPLSMPPSWWNGSRGGFRFVHRRPGTLLMSSYSGPRRVKAGEVLHFNFSLLVTPFRTIQTDSQWGTRFYHRYESIDSIIRKGANTINVHHATAVNPYINYPFLRPLEMKSYIDEAHAKGCRVKIYYTVRELSNRSPELFTLRSFGDEVLAYGSGGGFSWLQEHLDSNYIAAWFVPELKDAAVVTSGVSRWHNYYVEGLNWLVKNVGIDGIYIDDVAFDRTTMKRVRKILDRNRPGALIDLHSANQFNPNDGFANSANLYLEHFPYIDRLWFGEYFDYDLPPDFWLIEVSGIPFGLMGEMLEKGGNPWRGMIYGMTARLPWAGDPTPVWKVWDEFGITGSEMIGYWSPDAPVRTDDPRVLATTYRKNGKAMIALASWAPERLRVRLLIDWARLGLDPSGVTITAPAARGFQEGRTFKAGEEISVEPGKGWLIIIQ